MIRENGLAIAALEAGKAIAGEDATDLIFADNYQAGQFGAAAIAYLKAAPSAGALDVMGFGWAKHLILTPPPGLVDGQEEIAGRAFEFFEGFTGAAKGMLALNAPKKPAPPKVTPMRMPAPSYDNALTDRVDDEDLEERTESTDSIRVILPGPAPTAPAPIAPNLAAFKELPPETRRQFAEAFGFGEANEDFVAKLKKGAPLIDTKAPEQTTVITPESFEAEPDDGEPAERPK